MSTHAPVSLPGVPGPGELIAGKYRVESVIGQGGMGVVVSAEHMQLGQKVAIKFLLPGVLGQREPVERFLREARASVKIESEHVAKVLDVGELEGGSPYMVMEYLDGRDLGAMLDERGPLPIDEAVAYVLEACEALAEAHSHGIIHRDIKPSNLFLARRAGRGGVVKVLDFGISKALRDDDGKLTTTNITMGSPYYMSPEQIRSAKNIDTRSDIWSLGMVLYELLAGEPAYRAETVPALFVIIATEEPRPIQQLRPSVPDELAAVVMRCLSKEVSGRYASIAEVAQALAPFAPPRSREYAERITLAASRSVESLRLASPAVAEQNTVPAIAKMGVAASSGPAPSPAKRGPLLAVAGLASVVLFGAVALLRGESGPSRLAPQVQAATAAPSAPPPASAPGSQPPPAPVVLVASAEPEAPPSPSAAAPLASSSPPSPSPSAAAADPGRKGGVLPAGHASTQQPSKGPPSGKGIRAMLDDRR